MKNNNHLKSVLKELVSSNGATIFQRPSDLKAKLMEKSVDPTEALSVELVLLSCPSVAAALTRGQLNIAEINALITAATKASDLSGERVRSIITAMIDAAQIKHESFVLSDLQLQIQSYKGKVERALNRDEVVITYEEAYEEDVCREALGQIRSGKIDEGTSKLAMLAKSGNACAAYELGQFYLGNDGQLSEEKALYYYQIAAELGYGPAYGALARMEMRKQNPDIEKAALYFRQPIAISGEKGKEWVDLARKLRDFVSENVFRAKNLLVLAVIMFVAMFVPIVLGIKGNHPLLTCLDVILLLACGVLSVLNIFVTKYARQGILFRIIEVSWILLVLQIFL